MKDLIVYTLIVLVSIIVVIGAVIGVNMITATTYKKAYTVDTYKDKENNQEYLVFNSENGIAITPRLGREE